MKLRDYIEQNNISMTKFARRLGVKLYTLNSYTRQSKNRPSLKIAFAIEKITNGKVSYLDMMSEEDIEYLKNLGMID